MPRYHMHLRNRHVNASDREGVELPDLIEAKRHALAGIRDFLAHEVVDGRLDLRGQVDITDEHGVIIASMPFADAIAITKA